ncbi:MAG: class I SAM-dependent methyltransferase [Propionibacteriaceae bacterium]|nr:class I SAM-dependent methyltransferase [Propionibacteriaceae bacterium]
MSHYFVTPDGTPDRREVRTTIWGRDYVLASADGVFSATRLDPGTGVLFRLSDPPEDRPARFLDLGCGFGAIAAALAVECPHALVDAVDVNQRALDLTADNAVRLRIDDRVRALKPQDVPDDTAYDEIWSNPPIRIGKQALHELLDTWLPRLTPTGRAHLVVSKNLGADSLHSWLQARGWAVTRLGSAKGFRVLSVTRTASSCQPTR